MVTERLMPLCDGELPLLGAETSLSGAHPEVRDPMTIPSDLLTLHRTAGNTSCDWVLGTSGRAASGNRIPQASWTKYRQL